MPGYGPLRDAPNPVQRLAARSALAGSAFLSAFITSFTSLPLLLAGAPPRTLVIFLSGGFVVGTVIVWVDARRLTAEERGDNVVRYLPWFGRWRTEPPAGVAPPEPIRPFRRMLTRRTPIGTALQGAALGAGLSTPWWSRSIWIPAVAAVVVPA